MNYLSAHAHLKVGESAEAATTCCGSCSSCSNCSSSATYLQQQQLIRPAAVFFKKSNKRAQRRRTKRERHRRTPSNSNLKAGNCHFLQFFVLWRKLHLRPIRQAAVFRMQTETAKCHGLSHQVKCNWYPPIWAFLVPNF